MSNPRRPSKVVHDGTLTPAGTGAYSFNQPESLVDWSEFHDSGVVLNLDVFGTVGTADSWFLTAKWQVAQGDRDGAGWSRQTWRDLQPEQIARMVVEGVDWYAGVSTVQTRTNRITNPSLETVSAGWAAISGSGGTAAGSRLTTSGWSGTASYRVTWSAATTTANTGGIASQNGTVTAGEVVSGGIRVRPSKDQSMRANLEFRDAGNAVVATRQGIATACPGGVWTKLVVEDKTVPTGAVTAKVTAVAGNGSSAWAINDTLDGDAAILNGGKTTFPYFDGDSDGGSWSGTAHASTSTITVTPPGPDANVVARSTDALPINASRTLRYFGRYCRVMFGLSAVNPSADFAVRFALTRE